MLRNLQRKLLMQRTSVDFLTASSYSSINQAIQAKDKPGFDARDFYKNIHQLKFEDIHDVKKFATFVKENKPNGDKQRQDTNDVLNAFFRNNYRLLNPHSQIEKVKDIIDAGIECSYIYHDQTVDTKFMQDKWFWVWSGIEQEIRPHLRELPIREVFKTYVLFQEMQHGSDMLQNLIDWRIQTLDSKQIQKLNIPQIYEEEVNSVRRKFHPEFFEQ